MSAWSGLTEADYASALAQARAEWQESLEQDPGIEADGTPAKPYTLDEYLEAQIDCLIEDGVRRADDAYVLSFYTAAQAALGEEQAK